MNKVALQFDREDISTYLLMLETFIRRNCEVYSISSGTGVNENALSEVRLRVFTYSSAAREVYEWWEVSIALTPGLMAWAYTPKKPVDGGAATNKGIIKRIKDWIIRD